MKISACDLCRSTIRVNELRVGDYRFAVQQVDKTRGVRFKNIDICEKCFLGLLEKLVHAEGEPEQAKE